jgi:hypothetical protein
MRHQYWSSIGANSAQLRARPVTMSHIRPDSNGTDGRPPFTDATGAPLPQGRGWPKASASASTLPGMPSASLRLTTLSGSLGLVAVAMASHWTRPVDSPVRVLRTASRYGPTPSASLDILVVEMR